MREVLAGVKAKVDRMIEPLKAKARTAAKSR